MSTSNDVTQGIEARDATLVAFALHTLSLMSKSNGTADACITLERELYWAAIAVGLAQQSAGRTAVLPELVEMHRTRGKAQP